MIGLGTPWALAAGDEVQWLAPDWQGSTGGQRDAANNPLGLADPLGLRPVTDQELREIRDRMGRNVFSKAGHWAADNWEYIAAGVMVVGGVALMCTASAGRRGSRS